ncbi:hypothetical protein, partial [Thiolapillus sp.]
MHRNLTQPRHPRILVFRIRLAHTHAESAPGGFGYFPLPWVSHIEFPGHRLGDQRRALLLEQFDEAGFLFDELIDLGGFFVEEGGDGGLFSGW